MFLETINHGSNKLSANTALFDACLYIIPLKKWFYYIMCLFWFTYSERLLVLS